MKRIKCIAIILTILLCFSVATPTYAISDTNINTVTKYAQMLNKKYPELMNQIRTRKKKWNAHKGFSALAPENSTASYELAGLCGAYMIEGDVRMTKDGTLYMSHANSTEQMTGIKKLGNELTYNALYKLKFNAGSHFHDYGSLTYPKFETYLDICKKYHAKPYIHVKGIQNVTTREMAIEKLYKTIQAKNMTDQCIIGASQIYMLECLRKYDNGKIPIIFIQDKKHYTEDQLDAALVRYGKLENRFEKNGAYYTTDLPAGFTEDMLNNIWLKNYKQIMAE